MRLLPFSHRLKYEDKKGDNLEFICSNISWVLHKFRGTGILGAGLAAFLSSGVLCVTLHRCILGWLYRLTRRHCEPIYLQNILYLPLLWYQMACTPVLVSDLLWSPSKKTKQFSAYPCEEGMFQAQNDRRYDNSCINYQICPASFNAYRS